MRDMKAIVVSGAVLSLALFVAGCGGSAPPPKVEEPVEESRRSSGPVPVIQQELGSIDERAVQQTFAKLQSQLGKCQAQGRERVEWLSGEVKIFLRVDQSGKVRYGYFEESSLGDRDTEKCLLSVLSSAQWPKPIGGEAEIRNGFGFDAGGERPPASWGPEKVVMPFNESKDAKKDFEKCGASLKGELHFTGYVVHDESAEEDAPPPKKKGGAKGAAHGKDKDKKGGKFHAVGVATSNKAVAEKADCVVDVLKGLKLPSPGSYAAKVSFVL
jgi:hypothetical protein